MEIKIFKDWICIEILEKIKLQFEIYQFLYKLHQYFKYLNQLLKYL